MTAKVKRPRRARSDSVSNDLSAFATAAGLIEPPPTVKLRDGERPFWDLLMRARARDEWSEVDFQHAANFAACMADIERIKHDLKKEGDTVANTRGTLIVNPKHQLLETLTRRMVYLTRLLQLQASVLQGNLGEMSARRAVETEARKTAAEMHDDDDLLATPSRSH